MKLFTLSFIVTFVCSGVLAQHPVTNVTVISGPASTTSTYNDGVHQYDWGLNPYNKVMTLNGFSTAAGSYTYSPALSGVVKMRRVDNASITGNYTRIWAQTYLSGDFSNWNDYLYYTEYEKDMDQIFNSRTLNKGADNLFDNRVEGNNIERVDWIRSAGISAAVPSKMGFAVFERGTGSHEGFSVSVITSIDGSGNPTGYSNIIPVLTSDYGSDVDTSIRWSIVEGPASADLVFALAGGYQTRAGMFFTLQDFGIAANQVVYGYSIIPDDFNYFANPPSAIVNYANPAVFPNGTANDFDLVAVTGIFVDNTTLPLRAVTLNGNLNGQVISLNWKTNGEVSVLKHELERSFDGRQFQKIHEQPSKGDGDYLYAYRESIPSAAGNSVYYRTRSVDLNGKIHYSSVVRVSFDMKESIQFYPVPFIDKINFSVTSAESGSAKVVLFDNSGRKIRQHDFSLMPGTNFSAMEGLDKLPAGVYVVEVTTPGTSKRTSIVKSK